MFPGPPAGKNRWTVSGLSALSKTSSQFEYGSPMRSASRTASTVEDASLPGVSPRRGASSTRDREICAVRSAEIHQTTSYSVILRYRYSTASRLLPTPPMPCRACGRTAVAFSTSSRRCNWSRSSSRPVKFGFLGGMFPHTVGVFLVRSFPTVPGGCCGIAGLLFP